MVWLSPEYKAYIASEDWQVMRQRKFRQVGRRCQNCGFEGSPLQVHHLNYSRPFGHELLSDLRVLCVPCHEQETRRTRRRRQLRHWLGV